MTEFDMDNAINFGNRHVILDGAAAGAEITLGGDRVSLIGHIQLALSDRTYIQADTDLRSHKEILLELAHVGRQVTSYLNIPGTRCWACAKDGHEAINCKNEEVKYELLLESSDNGGTSDWNELCQDYDTNMRENTAVDAVIRGEMEKYSYFTNSSGQHFYAVTDENGVGVNTVKTDANGLFYVAHAMAPRLGCVAEQRANHHASWKRELNAKRAAAARTCTECGASFIRTTHVLKRKCSFCADLYFNATYRDILNGCGY